MAHLDFCSRQHFQSWYLRILIFIFACHISRLSYNTQIVHPWLGYIVSISRAFSFFAIADAESEVLKLTCKEITADLVGLCSKANPSVLENCLLKTWLNFHGKLFMNTNHFATQCTSSINTASILFSTRESWTDDYQTKFRSLWTQGCICPLRLPCFQFLNCLDPQQQPWLLFHRRKLDTWSFINETRGKITRHTVWISSLSPCLKKSIANGGAIWKVRLFPDPVGEIIRTSRLLR